MFRRIGKSNFFYEIAYNIDEIVPELDIKDNSYLAQVTAPGDRTTKNCVSFWISRDGDRCDLHFHSYPDKDTECYNPWVRGFGPFDRKGLKEIEDWLIDFLTKHAISVNEDCLEKRKQRYLKELEKLKNYINILNEIKEIPLR